MISFDWGVQLQHVATMEPSELRRVLTRQRGRLERPRDQPVELGDVAAAVGEGWSRDAP